MKKILLMILCCFSLNAFSADVDTGEGAKQAIEEQAKIIMDDLNANASKYASDPNAFEAFIEQSIGGRIDFEKMAEIALGRHLREVKDAGKFEDFERAFRNLLVKVYSQGWQNYTHATLKIIGTPVVDKYNRAQVRAQVTSNNGQVSSLNFALYYTGGIWKLYDATFENISLMTSYRNTFNTELQRGTIDQLIDKINAMDK